jgi:hypothetical protein
MAPVEQSSFPLSYDAAVKSIGELKTVGKARELPVVHDLETYTTTLANQISENAHVQSAKQIVEGGFKSLTENQTFHQLQGKVIELNENPRVKQTLDTVKDKVYVAAEHPRVKQTIVTVKDRMSGAVEHLDSMAAGGLDTLTTKLPALSGPTPELFETTKDAARSYFHLATEYMASFALAQVGLKVADKSLSMAEKTTKFLHGNIKDQSMLAYTYTKLRQTRRALRAIKRAGERKSYLEKDPVARTGLVGSLASLLSVNSLLGMAGLKIVVEKRKPAVTESVADDDDDNHREISDLKGDLAGYKSDEDPDYLPEDSEDSVDAESSGAESDDELSEETKEEHVEHVQHQEVSVI